MINCHTTNKKKRHYNMFSKSTSTINTNNIYIYKTSTICTLYNRLTYYITIIFDRNSLLVKNYSIYILYIKKKKKHVKI